MKQKLYPLFLTMLALAVVLPHAVRSHGPEAEQITFGATGVLPDSILYGIDILFEKIGDALTFSPNKKLARLTNHLDERIREYSFVHAAGKIKHAEKALLRYSQTVGRIAPLIKKLSDNAIRQTRISELTTKIMNHREILAGIYAKTSDDGHAAIRSAIDAAETSYQGIIGLASEIQRAKIEEIKELYDSEVQNYLEPREIAPPAAPISPSVPPPSNGKPACIKTGCSGQVCADEEMITTCEFRPEYVCYKTAKCERQPNGECGWTSTEELQMCLTKARQ